MEPDILRVPVGGGAALCVERYGQGAPPLVLLHGFGTSSFYWRAVAPILARIPLTIFAIDLLGYGDSDRPRDRSFDSDAQADALEAAFTELRIPRAPVAGNDIGGNAALALARTRPDRVESLILINTIVEGSLDHEPLREMRRSTARYAVRLARSITGAAPLLRPYLEQGVTEPAHMPEPLVARYLAPYVGHDGADHLIGLARIVAGETWEPEWLARVDAPVSYIWGEQADTLDARIVERGLGRFQRGRLMSFADAGRLVAEDVPDRLAGAIAELAAG